MFGFLRIPLRLLVILVSGSWITHVAVFWLFNSWLLAMEFTGRPHFLTKYKIQANKPVSAYIWHRCRWSCRVIMLRQSLLSSQVHPQSHFLIPSWLAPSLTT